jgi:putative flippase GtrA
MVINLAILHVLAGVLGAPSLPANLAGIALGTLWNFSANLGWTWRSPAVLTPRDVRRDPRRAA